MSDLFLFLNYAIGITSVFCFLFAMLLNVGLITLFNNEQKVTIHPRGVINFLLFNGGFLLSIAWLIIMWDKPCELDPECNNSTSVEEVSFRIHNTDWN